MRTTIISSIAVLLVGLILIVAAYAAASDLVSRSKIMLDQADGMLKRVEEKADTIENHPLAASLVQHFGDLLLTK